MNGIYRCDNITFRLVISVKNIMNIVNFARGCEPRKNDDSYLIPTLETELEYSEKYGFPTTVLLQYDALIKEEYRALVEKYSDIVEIGLWIEIVEPLVVGSGYEWRGRFPWDWFNDVGFTVGYTREERKVLLDTAFEEFRKHYGRYPEVAGSWHIDAFSLEYIQKKYGLKAFCICKEQYGTDGYTLWGGYYNGAYYPCSRNVICPASTKENQIDIPVFRMLGPDPIYQYDMGMDNPDVPQGVSSLEPVYKYGGADRNWVKWYLRENYNGKGLALSYSQTGQENSFGWDKISRGLPMQYELLKEKSDRGEIEIMTLGQAGDWFRENYEMTPPSAICADSDYTEAGCRSLWYSCKNYRTNFLYKDGKLWIRDFYLFNEKYPERFLYEKDKSRNCGYYNLPVVDGFRFSDENVRAGLYLFSGDSMFVSDSEYSSSVSGDKTASAFLGSDAVFTACEDQIEIRCGEDKYLRFVFGENKPVSYVSVSGNTMFLHFDGYDNNPFDYSVILAKGRFETNGQNIDILPEDGIITISTICGGGFGEFSD